MLKIRLQRVGRRNDPSFRAVCVDSRKGPKAGKHTEVLGSYDPKRDYIAINGERVKHWISNGAQVSDTMHNILVKEGIIKGKKIHVARGKKKVKAEAEETKAEGETKTEGETAEAPKEKAPNPPADGEEKSEEKPAEAEAPKEEPKEPEPTEEKKEEAK